MIFLSIFSQVTLTDEDCEVCHPVGKSERVESRQICLSIESRKCSNDVDGKWVKMCRKIDGRKPMLIGAREPRQNEVSFCLHRYNKA